MPNVSIHWRPSGGKAKGGGRGEFEYVPSHSLDDKNINLTFEPIGVTIPAEVKGEFTQGKPRLRKFDSNNRKKLHLPSLVMSVARLPDFMRQDLTGTVKFPLENKEFLIESMDFEVIDDTDDTEILLAPLRVKILHSNVVIDLQDRLKSIAKDAEDIDKIKAKHPELGEAIEAHYNEVMLGKNNATIRSLANDVLDKQLGQFGQTNACSVTELDKAESMPEADGEDLYGKEGRLLMRMHTYKERDKKFAAMVKKAAKKAGKLVCEACGMDPVKRYGGSAGERAVEAHHKIPVEELLADSITRVEDMAIICASCHRVVHSRKPCLTIDEVKALIGP